MGSYAECWIGNFFVGTSKNGIDPSLMRHFRASDKAVYRGNVKKLPFMRRHWTQYLDDDVVEAVYYRVPLPVVKERLELDGYTLPAGIVNRVVAVFDNDTAGQSAVESLKSIGLRRNIQAIALPDAEWLRKYPTIGPSGPVSMDVNGMAASIELYLGADVLKAKSDCLIPIQWTGYDQKAKQYQGEVLYKDQIHDKFSDKLERCRSNPKAIASADWDGMRLIWRTIFVAFHGVDHDDILRWAEFEADY